MRRNAFCLWTCALPLGLCAVVWADGPAANTDRPIAPAEGLKRIVPRPFLNGTLTETLTRCQKWAGVKILVDWEGLEKAGVKPDARVALALKRAAVSQILDLTLIQVARPGKPLGWFVADENVHVTTQRRVLARRELLSRRRPSRDARGGRSPRPGRIRELSFQKTPLSDVFQFLRDFSGLNLHVNWRALEMSNVAKENLVTLNVKNVSVRRALDLVVGQLAPDGDKFGRVYWVVEGNVVTISTGSALNTTLRTKVLDIGDLIMPIRNFKGPRVEVSAQQHSGDNTGDKAYDIFKDEDDSDEDGGSGDRRKELADNLIGIIKDSIGEDMWAPEGKGSIRLHRNRLVISQTQLGFKLLEQSTARR